MYPDICNVCSNIPGPGLRSDTVDTDTGDVPMPDTCVGVSQVILRQPVNVGSVLIFMIHETQTHTPSPDHASFMTVPLETVGRTQDRDHENIFLLVIQNPW